MKIEYFIAHRIISANKGKSGATGKILNFAVYSIALGLAFMLISVAILIGFKHEIRNKLSGFGSHIQIVNYDSNSSFESEPIGKNQFFYPYIDTIKGIKHINVYVRKPGIIKTKGETQGIVLKGIDTDFDWSFFSKKLVEGKILDIKKEKKTNSVLISRQLAKLLKLKLGDPLYVYFIQYPPRVRKFIIKGIYSTGLEEFDKLFVICDIKHLQKLNSWSPNQISGFELWIDNFDEIDKIESKVRNIAGNYFTEEGSRLKIISIKELYPQIFDWLNLINSNVWIILTIMTIVVSFNMITALLILIIDRMKMIATLKAIGATDWQIQKIFTLNALYLIIKGFIIGDLLAFIIIFLQIKFELVPLPPASYYVDHVPMEINFSYIFIINVAIIALITIIMLAASRIITRFKPSLILNFE